MEHSSSLTTSEKRRAVSSRAKGGRPSARLEERVNGNCDIIAIYSDHEAELIRLCREQGRALQKCQRAERAMQSAERELHDVEHKLCEEMCATRNAIELVRGLREQRRRENIALCGAGAMA